MAADLCFMEIMMLREYIATTFFAPSFTPTQKSTCKVRALKAATLAIDF